jgi:hypothetical protein
MPETTMARKILSISANAGRVWAFQLCGERFTLVSSQAASATAQSFV